MNYFDRQSTIKHAALLQGWLRLHFNQIHLVICRREPSNYFFYSHTVIILLYYTLLEGAKGKTLGKLITKTKAVQIDGAPLSYKKAFLRSLCRFVPLDFISIFFSRMMWHDQWTYTMVVKDK